MSESAEQKYEEITLPNGQKVFYSDETHTYIVNGMEVPSITSLLPLVYGDSYAQVSPDILKKAAEYGTTVHNELQEWIEKRFADSSIQIPLDQIHPETRNYFCLIEPLFKVEPVMTEKVVVLYAPNGRPVAAGRFDLLCRRGGQLTLADFKTTSTLHRKLVTAQLNLYKKAATQSGYFSKEDNVALGAIQLHGTTSKYVEIVQLSEDFYLDFLI